MGFKEEFMGYVSKAGLTVNKLTELMGYKSRNKIYRLLKCEQNITSSCSVLNEIYKSNVLNISNNEMLLLNNMLCYDTQLNKKKQIYAPLVAIYNNDKRENCILNADGKIMLRNILKKYKAGQINIFYSSITSKCLTDELCELLKEEKEDYRVTHLVNFSGGEAHVANEIAAIVRMSRYDAYKPYLTSKYEFRGLTILAETGEKCFLILSELKFGKKAFLETEISRELYEYYASSFTNLISKSTPLKNIHDDFTDMAGQMLYFAETEKSDLFCAEGDVCFGELDGEILHRLLFDIDFFGVSKNSDLIQDLANAIDIRSNTRKTYNKEKKYLFSLSKMEEYLKSRKAHDNPEFLSPLTLKEMRKTMDELNNNPKIQYRFLKYDIKYDISYCPHFGIYTYNADLKYGEGHYTIIIKDSRAMSVFEDFADYLWENHTYSAAESKAMLNKMMKKYNKK